MKKIALITRNKILGESLATAMNTMRGLEFEFFLLLNSHQVLLDAEIFQIDVALIDMVDGDKEETVLSFCESLHKSLPSCHLLFLVSQDDPINRRIATEAKESGIIDDFVFYDASVKYLFAKLAAF